MLKDAAESEAALALEAGLTNASDNLPSLPPPLPPVPCTNYEIIPHKGLRVGALKFHKYVKMRRSKFCCRDSGTGFSDINEPYPPSGVFWVFLCVFGCFCVFLCMRPTRNIFEY